MIVRLVPSKSDSRHNKGDWHIDVLGEDGTSLDTSLGVVRSPTEDAINIVVKGAGWEVFKYIGDNQFVLKAID